MGSEHLRGFGSQGVVRVENLEDASEYIGPVLERVKPEYLVRAYKVKVRQPCHRCH